MGAVVIWGVVLIIGLIITIITFRENTFDGTEMFIAFFGIWFIGAIVAFIGSIAKDFIGFNWTLSAFTIAAICSMAGAIVLAREEASVIWIGIAGLFLYIAILLGTATLGTEIGILAGWKNKVLGGVVFAVFWIVIYLFYSAIWRLRQRKKQAQAEAVQQAERERAEQQRIKEQNQRAYDQWEKNEESEISNLLK